MESQYLLANNDSPEAITLKFEHWRALLDHSVLTYYLHRYPVAKEEEPQGICR